MEASMEVTSLLDALDPEQKLILSLRELEGYSYEDLAEMLKCPMNTVKSRLNRAREALSMKEIWPTATANRREHSRQQNRLRK